MGSPQRNALTVIDYEQRANGGRVGRRVKIGDEQRANGGRVDAGVME
jgi:hypothetical protein